VNCEKYQFLDKKRLLVWVLSKGRKKHRKKGPIRKGRKRQNRAIRKRVRGKSTP
jgi:hypothetical protein